VSRIKHIDGLRAVSIFSVVFYHAFPSVFPNGYIGVDYFLVISGFVISKKYFINSSEKFSLSKFWSKRISRLYPQLLCCIAFCIPVSWFTMHPDHLENFSQSAISSLLGINNILLYLTGGYWNLANDLKPLFTTWSLGLEEQFYFLIAIAFAISHNRFKSEIVQKIFLTIFISSIIASGFGTLYFRTANYLLLPTRFWEFSIGIYAAFISQEKQKWVTNWLTNLSFFMILVISIVFPIKTALYAPNPLFLIPLSAIAIICISSNMSISIRILSSKILVYIGLSSYSIYLYHQPLLAFSRLKAINDINISTSIVLVLVSFLIGFLMYELIEKKKIFDLLGNRLLVLQRPKSLVISSLIIVLINIIIISNYGFFNLRFPYMLVEGKPPIGFLGGKGYTDHPYIYQYKKFPLKKKEVKEKNNVKTLNIFLAGNSKTRDLINSLEIIDEMNPNLKFNFSYNSSLMGNVNKDLLEKADLLIIQIYKWGREINTINDEILEQYAEYSEKLLWHKSREQFVKNITPIMFIKNKEERSNFKYNSTDSYSCKKENVFSNKFEPINSALGMLDTQCAFNDPEGLKILTSKQGEIYSFDGTHLTLAGASHLAKSLISSEKFIKILRTLNL
tara:strand:+ start:4180 stop:6036 length:1857 start_codon:yes stop_codon:yes gene_type:complete